MKQRLSAHHSIREPAFRGIATLLNVARRTVGLAALCFAVAILVPAGRAQDVTFSKTRYSSVKQPKEADVVLTITDSKILIKGKKADGIDLEIPYSSIDSMTYELATRHRSELLGISPVMALAIKTKSHWLDLEYRQGDSKQLTTLRLDKSEYKKVIATLEATTGKHIAALESKTSPLNPTAGSKDMDELVPSRMDAVAAAMKPAMESVGCHVTKATAERLECKRPWAKDYDVERTGTGGEQVTAKLKAKGEQTRVSISTEKGFRGRLVKKNWSTPIYQEMMKNLQQPPEHQGVELELSFQSGISKGSSREQHQ